ncbi:MAG: DNA repair protein RadC [Bacteroidota bacterium]|nr:DNA repair protein RadC [Bacteroidota bacterium]
MNNQSIKNWAIDDRPREKLALKGAESLSNSELLAILINNGSTDKSAVDLAKELLAAVENNLQRLAKLSVKEMVNLKIKGLGPVKAITIAAALELGVRRNMADNKKETVLSSKDIAGFLHAQLQYKSHEVFAVVFLNRSNKINHYEIISEGGITGTVADPRIILKKALTHEAVSIVLCHNHPSGNLKPSRQDQELTAKIKEAAHYFDIKVLDHIIVSEEGYFSFADDGIL